MKYKVGDRVRITSTKKGPHWNTLGGMDKWLGKTVTIASVCGSVYTIEQDGRRWDWYEHMIEGLAEDEDIVRIVKRGNELIALTANTEKVIYTFGFEKPPEFRPHLKLNSKHLGYLGEPTSQTTIFGEPLFVGDIVELYCTERNKLIGTKIVCKTESFTEGFVSGVARCIFVNGISGSWQIRKTESYKDINYRSVDEIQVVLE